MVRSRKVLSKTVTWLIEAFSRARTRVNFSVPHLIGLRPTTDPRKHVIETSTGPQGSSPADRLAGNNVKLSFN